jgi:hypothetical protein
MLEFDALLKRARIRQNYALLNAGTVAAMIWNCAPGDPDREPKSPLDFVPDWKPKPVDLTELTPEQQRNYLISLFQKRTMR